MRRLCISVAAIAACLWLSSSALAATSPSYAPLDQPGPPLTVPLAQLQGSLNCEASVKNATVTPVLLNPATGVTAVENYSWNWEPALTKLGIPWCAYTAPNSTLNNIATSGEYIVYAIRTMYAMAGRKIDIMGHSQGGMSMRWALRFWPDTRTMVDDVIGFSGSNHGTTVLPRQDCESLGCVPATWQQLANSNFINALNSGAETFAGISYTEIWTHTDEVVQPNGDAATASAALHTGAGEITNVPTQQLCPADVDEHLLIGTVDPVAYAIAVDALQHPGPADIARVQADNPNLCGQLYMPGVNPAELSANLAILKGGLSLASVAVGPLGPTASGAPNIAAEPALPCYVFATCTGSAAPSLVLKLPYKHVTRGASTPVHAQVLALEGSTLEPVSDATVIVAGHQATTDSAGWVTVRAPLKTGSHYTVRAELSGANSASATIHPS